MAQLIDIRKVVIDPRSLTAQIRLADDAPLLTSDDPAGTESLAALIPELAEHACFGDGGETFGDVMGNTELAHLLEHVTVELLARTNRAGKVSTGQTRALDGDERAFEIRIACPDDVLVAGALSSASWIIDWAYGAEGADDAPVPDVDAIAKGLADLVDSLAADTEKAPEPIDDILDPNATIAAAPFVFDDQEPADAEDSGVADDLDEPDGEPAPEPESDSNQELEEVQQDVLGLPHFDI